MIRHIYHGIRNSIIGFAIGVVIYFVVLALVWLLYPYQTANVTVPIDVTNLNHQVSKTGKLQLSLYIDKQSDYTPTVSRNIICNDSKVYLIPASGAGGSARPRGKFIAESSYPLPLTIHVGDKCVFVFMNEYKVNPLRTITKTFTSEVFEVVE